MDWRVIADMAIGVSVPLIAAVLFAARLMPLREIFFLILGVLIGTVFEFFIGLMGPGFIQFKLAWPLPRETIFLCHSLWDGGLFMAGYALARLVTRKPRPLSAFDPRELAVMTAWGAGSAFVVELIGNGKIWEYQPVGWNPVWITLGGQGYTIFIQLVWVVAPAVFYFGCLGIARAMRRNHEFHEFSQISDN